MSSQIKKQSSIPMAAATAAVILLSLFSGRVTDSCADALVLCATSVVPSLFPFMVMSRLLAHAAALCPARRGRLLIPIITGLLCGMTVGTVTVTEMYKRGSVRRSSAEAAVALFATAGPAFTVGVIGSAFFGSACIGWIFYICQILATAFVYCSFRLIRRLCAGAYSANAKYTAPVPHSSPMRLHRLFCSAVGDGAVGVIGICGYIIFFRVILDLLSLLHPSPLFRVILAVIGEFTSAAQLSSAVGGTFGIFLCGTALGFSGLSVLAQCASSLTSAGLSPRFLLIVRAVAAPVSGLLCVLFSGYTAASAAVVHIPLGGGAMLPLISGLIVLVALFLQFWRLLGQVFPKLHL